MLMDRNNIVYRPSEAAERIAHLLCQFILHPVWIYLHFIAPVTHFITSYRSVNHGTFVAHLLNVALFAYLSIIAKPFVRGGRKTTGLSLERRPGCLGIPAANPAFFIHSLV